MANRPAPHAHPAARNMIPAATKPISAMSAFVEQYKRKSAPHTQGRLLNNSERQKQLPPDKARPFILFAMTRQPNESVNRWQRCSFL